MSYSAISPHNQLPPTGCYTSDGKYQALPDNTAVRCQLMDFDGNFIKPDNTLGQQMVELARICDFRVYKSDILYMVSYQGNGYSTKASLCQTMTKQEIENILQG
tara:strand:- start:117 stop:428 length:312 start_codon:yes stop_codon:yes gene_type:complete